MALRAACSPHYVALYCGDATIERSNQDVRHRCCQAMSVASHAYPNLPPSQAHLAPPDDDARCLPIPAPHSPRFTPHSVIQPTRPPPGSIDRDASVASWQVVSYHQYRCDGTVKIVLVVSSSLAE